MAIEVGAAAPPRWSRAYPPLLLLAVAVLVAALVLPSALNMPQSNPSTVLEYAPVPPEDDNPPPPAEGNVSSLGLGRSNSLTEGGQPPPPPPPPPPPDQGSGSKPSAKRCVEGRQTEDPMSPPCVPFFDGDNFGATYQGVTGEEIKVLIYLDVGCYKSECPPTADRNKIIDLDREPKPACPESYPAAGTECDFVHIRIARAFGRYFNDRFQTYKRRVHYYMYISGAGDEAGRRNDAQKIWSELRPFAVLDQATFTGFNEDFEQSATSRGMMAFTQQTAMPNSFFRRAAPRSWAFWPDVEHWAEQYVSYICSEVAPFPVKRYGNPPGQGGFNGQERVFGLYYTSDDGEPGLRHFVSLAKRGLQDCGVEWAAEAAYPRNGFVTDGGDDGQAQLDAVNKFRSNNVTTVLWLGGVEGRFTQSADAARYYPEIVFADDLDLGNNVTARNQNRNVWQNAWGTHFQLRFDRPEDQPGYTAYREGDPRLAKREEARYADDVYRDHFMLFQAIQVAGPRLTPANVDEGFHAIPENRSSSPYVAAFFFDPGDYSSIKDSTEIWWDPDGIPPGGADTGSASGVTGCYRMVNEGSRYLAWNWPGHDDVFVNGQNDPCTGFENSRRLSPT